MKGLVVKSTGSWYEVRQEDGRVIPCRLRGQFRIKGIKNTNPVVVGDFVQYELEKDGNGWITTIEPSNTVGNQLFLNITGSIIHLHF